MLLFLFQNTPPELAFLQYKDVAFAVVFVATVFTLFKYFREEVRDLKDTNKEYTAKFIEVTEKFIVTTEKQTEAIRDLEQMVADENYRRIREEINRTKDREGGIKR